MNSWWNTGLVGSEVTELRLDERESQKRISCRMMLGRGLEPNNLKQNLENQNRAYLETLESTQLLKMEESQSYQA